MGHAHVATRDSAAPADPGAWGWRLREGKRRHQRAEWSPQGARVGWLDVQNLLFDIDSAYRAPQATAADGDGIPIGVQTLVKRLHEANRLNSIDERRRKLRVRRMLGGRRQEVLHLHANVLEERIVDKTGPIGPSTGAKEWPARRFGYGRGHFGERVN